MIGRLVGLALLLCGAASQAEEVTTAAEAVARLRTGYWRTDFATAAAAGKGYVARFPDALDVRAWTLVNQSLSGDSTGIAAAQALAREHPESPWSWFALIVSQVGRSRLPEREAASETMMALAGKPLSDVSEVSDDFVIARAQVLGERRSRIPEAVALLDARLSSAGRRVEVLLAKAQLLFSQGDSHPGSLDQSLAVFAAARQADPTCSAAYHNPGKFLVAMGRTPEGLPLLRRAIELDPDVVPYRRVYWRAVGSLPDRPAEEKRREIEPEIAALLALRSDAVALLSVASQYFDLGDDAKSAEYEARLLRQFPASLQADLALRQRPRRLAQRRGTTPAEDPALRAEMLASWRAYLAYPHHVDPEPVQQAWSSVLTLLAQDPATPDAEILAAVRGLDGLSAGRFSTYSLAATTLAARRLALDDAERLARQALAEMPGEILRIERITDGPKEAAEVEARVKGGALDVLGQVLLARGRLDDARRELLAAEATDPKSPHIAFHLGRLAERASDLGGAEGHYARGKALPTPEKNPNEEALQALYQKRHGSLDGYEAYLASLDQGDQAKRKTAVLAERIASPEPLPAFSLKTLSGATVSQADLEGKVAVIHFWGVWCTWCLLEMADVDALAKRYADDPDVLVLTVNNDPKLETPRKWLAEKKYGFPVLLDDGYGPKGGVVTYPTTWYVGRDGRVAFKHSGWSQKLAEDSGWRVEALKEEPEAPAVPSAGR